MYKTEAALPQDKNEYIFPIQSKCETCGNVARDYYTCEICDARLAYADYTIGNSNSKYSWKTGPEILKKSKAKYSSQRNPKRADGKNIIKIMGYETECDLLQDLYFDQKMGYGEVAKYIRLATNGPCTKSYVVCVMVRCGRKARNTNDYRDESGRFNNERNKI